MGSHVAYTSDGTERGTCPPSHPVRLPLIQLFFRIFNYKGGHYTFADDSSVFHADYMMGWDQAILQNVLDNCQESTFDTAFQDSCRNFLTYRTPSLEELSVGCNDDDCDPFPLLLNEVRALQPNPPLDTQGTIAPEPISGFTSPPRGTCSGTLLPLDGGDGGPPPTASPQEQANPNPTASPIQAPTVSPQQQQQNPSSPTCPPVTSSPVTSTVTEPYCHDGCIEEVDECERDGVNFCVEDESECRDECDGDSDCLEDCDYGVDECFEHVFFHCDEEFEFCLEKCDHEE